MTAGLLTLAALISSDSYLPVLAGGLLIGAGLGTAMAPASAALMSSLPRDHAGVGSALNDTLQELGAAFGVAVLGTVLAAVYRAHLPAGTPAAARSSLAGAVGLGDPAVTTAARTAFDTALSRGLVVGAVAALAGAAVGWWALRTPSATAAAPAVVSSSLEPATP
jgi:hypothetical protein